MNDPEYSVPAIMKYALENLEDVDKLDPNKLTLEQDAKFRTVKILVEKIGKDVPIGVLISDPFTAASSVYKTEYLLRATRKDKDNLHKLIRFCTDGLKKYIENLLLQVQ